MIPIIEMHCDTIYKIYELRRKGQDVRLRSNNLHLDLLRMKEAGYMAQCFALFTYMPYTQERRILRRLFGDVCGFALFIIRHYFEFHLLNIR